MLPVELVVDEPLPAHAQRLMDTLGVPVEVREVTTVVHETITCPVKACSWTWVGVPSKAQPFVDAHLKLMHASANGASRQTEGRDLLDQMDRGERIAKPAEPTHSGKRRWTREEILDAFHRWHREHGRQPTSTQWNTAGEWWPSLATVVQYFGKWNDAIAAAGFEPRASGHNRRGEAPPEPEDEAERLSPIVAVLARQRPAVLIALRDELTRQIETLEHELQQVNQALDKT